MLAVTRESSMERCFPRCLRECQDSSSRIHKYESVYRRLTIFHPSTTDLRIYGFKRKPRTARTDVGAFRSEVAVRAVETIKSPFLNRARTARRSQRALLVLLNLRSCIPGRSKWQANIGDALRCNCVAARRSMSRPAEM